MGVGAGDHRVRAGMEREIRAEARRLSDAARPMGNRMECVAGAVPGGAGGRADVDGRRVKVVRAGERRDEIPTTNMCHRIQTCYKSAADQIPSASGFAS